MDSASPLAQFPARPEQRRRHQIAKEQSRVFLSADVAAAIRLEVARQIAVQVIALGKLGAEQLRKICAEVAEG